MTEDEARRKWCPFARVAVINTKKGAAANRWPDDEESEYATTTNHCIGSSCMAWRQTGFLPGHRWQAHNDEQKHEAFIRSHPLEGFCGLAGKPEWPMPE
jgi:hypothetical protein